jgi:hypothetical protein
LHKQASSHDTIDRPRFSFSHGFIPRCKTVERSFAHILVLFFFRFTEFVVVVFYSGFHELIELDGRFDAYSKTLFSVDSIQMDRELQSQEFNAKLNNSISSFLRLLSSYIMLTPAHQALEYLVRRYK